ncbi:MAG: indolepyruvate oxidoreductase subunit beta [Spirochaetales bacterium]|uniref:Indolepyruvate oxidoreductase subunit beta n=1 Tax=Candidatus Thalassospirochaeta sargassi TaxID=3119039 RepID=A0AAJ1II78_9SPIO|nr:indolepyruvate oxidoreductase subunit beta [Spirochaetales bacterium]
MKYDIILAGVGGQGVLSVAAGIATGAMLQGLQVRQSEVHGMAQRGGAVMSHLRISDTEIPGDLVGEGSADMILSMEPLEALRYLAYLKPDGKLVTASDPFINIPNYPDEELIKSKVDATGAGVVVDAKAIAKESGNLRAANMAMVGAASTFLPVEQKNIEKAIENMFASKGDTIIEQNIKAFRAGRG